MGYGVEWSVLNSKHFGVPQSRKRVFIIGYLDQRCAGKILPVFGTKDAKAWETLTAAETKRYLALGFIGNGVDFWFDGQAHSLGVIDKGSTASYAMQGRFGFAWEQAASFLYGMTIKVNIAG